MSSGYCDRFTYIKVHSYIHFSGKEAIGRSIFPESICIHKKAVALLLTVPVTVALRKQT
ncbi:MAG: hypothetical protein N2235_07260 [Fischerella sp.]|nr:hypothetical protein [Fischerella sp.]